MTPFTTTITVPDWCPAVAVVARTPPTAPPEGADAAGASGAGKAGKRGGMSNAERQRKWRKIMRDAAAEIERLRGLSNEIANNHHSDGHFCQVCGAEGGRWPCATYLTAIDARRDLGVA